MELDEKRAARGIAPGPHAPEAIVTPRYQSANDKFDNQRQLKICVSITILKISEATTTSTTAVSYTARILAASTINVTYASLWPRNDPPRARTWNLRLRRPTPYPLGQQAS